MQWFAKRVGVRAIMMMILVIVLSATMLQAQDAGSTNASPAATTAPAGSVDVAKAAQPPANDTPPPRVAADVKPDSYIIGTEDILAINVWKEPEMSRTVPVRPDGMISLPLLGEIKAVGLTPVELREKITEPLKKIMADPQVTVIVTEVHSLSFNIVGNAMKPGYYPLTRRMTVLDAIALAGGFRDFAKEKAIYVLRHNPDGTEIRLKFNYKDVIRGKNVEQNIKLQARDSLVVP